MLASGLKLRNRWFACAEAAIEKFGRRLYPDPASLITIFTTPNDFRAVPKVESR
jgi:hypothetical protein